MANLARRYAETDSEYVRQKMNGYMSRQPCTGCAGARLRPESLACRVNGKSILDVTRQSIRAAADFFAALPLTPAEEQIAREVVKEIRQRLRFMIEDAAVPLLVVRMGRSPNPR